MQSWKDMRMNQPHCSYVYIPIIAPMEPLQCIHNLITMYAIKHFPSTLSLVVFFWASTRTAMSSIYLPLLTYLKWSNNLVLHYTPLLCCLSWDYLLCFGWDCATLRQASHREHQGRERNTLISQVMVFDTSLFQHCFLSKLFPLKYIITCV